MFHVKTESTLRVFFLHPQKNDVTYSNLIHFVDKCSVFSRVNKKNFNMLNTQIHFLGKKTFTTRNNPCQFTLTFVFMQILRLKSYLFFIIIHQTQQKILLHINLYYFFVEYILIKRHDVPVWFFFSNQMYFDIYLPSAVDLCTHFQCSKTE